MIISCKPPIPGRVVITEQEFFIRKSSTAWTVDVKGQIKNIGEVDVKNIKVHGSCKSCGEIFNAGKWVVGLNEESSKQKIVIQYLPAGAQEDFSFQDIAFQFNPDGTKPTSLPDGLKCEIRSFESIQK
jgi:hypothetical protein